MLDIQTIETSVPGEISPDPEEYPAYPVVFLPAHPAEHAGIFPVIIFPEQERQVYAVAAAKRAALRMPAYVVTPSEQTLAFEAVGIFPAGTDENLP